MIYVTITDGHVTIFQIRLQTLMKLSVKRNIRQLDFNYSLFVDF